MTILTMRRAGSPERAGGRDRRPSLPACLTLAALVMLGASAAHAQARRPSVEVDLGALDALGPPAAGAPQSRILLHMPAPPPAKRTAKTAPSAPAETAPVKAPAPPPSDAAAAPAPPAPAQAATEPSLTPPPLQAARIPPPPDLPPPAIGANAKPTPPEAAARDAVPALGPVEDRIIFPAAGVKLPDDAKAELNRLAKRLSANGHLYVQLVAYAGGESDASQARRVSLSRALAARSYLIDQGVDIKQVDVRPLGNRTEPGLPADRVDLVVAER